MMIMQYQGMDFNGVIVVRVVQAVSAVLSVESSFGRLSISKAYYQGDGEDAWH